MFTMIRTKMECIFCNQIILKKETFYEDSHFIAVYNIRPVVKGHCLVIPKRHVLELGELNAEERKDFLTFSNKAVFLALEYSGVRDFDFLLQKGENAGQSIKHLHFHILPRKRNDVLSVSKKEFFRSFAEKENAVDTLSGGDLAAVVKELKDLAEKHRLRLETL
jgi:histidine triad (HIT) family protein